MTFPLFYEDIYDAMSKAANGNPRGLTLKQIACELWPSRNPDTARSVLSRALNPENVDAHLSPEDMVRFMEICGAEHLMFFYCDRFGYERPAKKDKAAFEQEIKSELKNLVDGVAMLGRKMKELDRVNETSKKKA